MSNGLLSGRVWRAVAVAVLGVACGSIVDVSGAFAVTRVGELGSEAGQVTAPIGVAVDASGALYVGDEGNKRLDKFDASGAWQWAAGVGVLDGAFESQVCTTSCMSGTEQGSPEGMKPDGVTVDTDPLSSSYGDIYVVDEETSRVLKFDSAGNFILMFGGKVNEEASPVNPDICKVGEKCRHYAETGTANGEFSYMPEQSPGQWGFSSFIAVGAGGAVYVGDKARVEVFEPSGEWKEDISLAGLSIEARPTALAVDNGGNLFVKDAEASGVRELEPNGTEKSVRFDARSSTVTGLAVDGAGHLFVGDSNGGFRILEYDSSSGSELASFGAGVVHGEDPGGLAFSPVTGDIYVPETERVNSNTVADSTVLAMPIPPAGPDVVSEAAVPGLRGAATLEALVNPEGSETSVRFEYVDNAHFKVSGYASASSTNSVSVPADFEDQPISTEVTLAPGTTYHFRVVASSSQGTTVGDDASVQETPSALISGVTALDVSATSATLEAKINPLGADTSYKLEYGTSTSYGQVATGGVGNGMNDVTISHHFQGLRAATEYHYRVVTSNEVGQWQSSDHVFTTQDVGGELTLPDGRAWELVSPANKHGALIAPYLFEGVTQAASDGTGIAYGVSAPISERPLDDKGLAGEQALSLRQHDGWHTQEVEAGQRLSSTEGEPHAPFPFGVYARLFSADLSQVVIEPYASDSEPLAPVEPGSQEATERTLYLRNLDGSYLPLVTPADVPTGTKFGGEMGGLNGEGSKQEMMFVAATSDLSHVVLKTSLRLTENAAEGSGNCEIGQQACPMNLYEWSDGRLALIDVLPDGESLVGEGEDGAYLGRGGSGDVASSISADGRWIVWEHGFPGGTNTYPLYVRDVVGERTWQVGGPRPMFEEMAGSWLFYRESRELYAYNVETHTTTDLTANHGLGEQSAAVRDGFDMAVSKDGSYAYYVAMGVLASGAASGEDNLYMSHYDGTHWLPPVLIATLSKADVGEWFTAGSAIDYPRELQWRISFVRVSPNGRYFAFMSNRSLTGYDNVDVSEQETEDQVVGPNEGVLRETVTTRVHHDEEAYLYDAVRNSVVCVSCNATGARPEGIYSKGEVLGVAHLPKYMWFAASFPEWAASNGQAAHQPRYLSDSGSVFFNSSDSLAAQDTNGVGDVYEYEPAGAGRCDVASTTFVERSNGCVSLVSSGTAADESSFLDASENGDDAFFMTTSKLVNEDFDNGYDVYDAHVCSASVPCRAAPVAPPECSSGDSCKAAPSPQPEVFGPAPSATFSGVGNFSEEPKSTAKHLHKSKHKHRVKRKRRKHKRRHLAGSRAGVRHTGVSKASAGRGK